MIEMEKDVGASSGSPWQGGTPSLGLQNYFGFRRVPKPEEPLVQPLTKRGSLSRCSGLLVAPT